MAAAAAPPAGQAPLNMVLGGMKRSSRAVDAEDLLKKTMALIEHLPETRVELQKGHASFLVSEKKFAWFLNDHHGDGMICICVKMDPELKESLIDFDLEKYLRPAYVSRFGWMSIRIDTGPVDWTEIEQRLIASFKIVAPKKIVAALS